MPIIYRIDVLDPVPGETKLMGLIVTRCFGRVTLAEVQEHFEELASAWPPVDRLDVLLDLTDQTSLPALRDLEEVARTIDAQIGPPMFDGQRRTFGRCAVVTEHYHLHGSMQMFEVLVGRLFDAIEIFRTESAARVWLVPTPKASHTLTTQ